MSKDFFAVIGDELFNIKNSPFSRIGQSSNLKNSSINNNNPNIINEPSSGLSYNPDRLFDPQKYKNTDGMSQDYIEFKKDEQEETQRIEITMLKQTANQEYRKHIQKAKNLQKQDFHHPFSIFKVYRSVCSLCNKCQQYNGNFNRNSSIAIQYSNSKNNALVQFMECNLCSCPMNSHLSMPSANKFTDQIFSHMSKISLTEQLFQIRIIPLCFIKHENTSIHTIMNDLYNVLPQLGFSIMSTKIMSKNKFQLFQVKNEVLQGNQKQMVQKMLKVIECLQNDQAWNWQKELADQTFQQNFQIIKKLIKKIKLKKKLQNFHQVIVCFVKNQSNLSFQEIQTIFKMHQHQMLNNSPLLWLPQKLKNCFTSACLLFPQFFQLNHQIFVLPSQKTKQEYQKASSRFKDLLDYNQYTIIGQIKQIERQNLQQILKWQNANKVNYILGQQMLNKSIKRAGVYMSAKIGPSIFMIPFKNAVDFIQISSAQKRGPFMMAFPQFLISQRCMLILRPCFSLSNCQQILMTLLRINNFILLKRIKINFNEGQAKYLGVLEHIEEDRMKAYMQFMTSGLCEMVLVSKRGAIYQANIIANGCEDGISTTKTKTFKESLTIEIRRGNQIYEYQPLVRSIADNSFSPFKSMKDLFKVERVLFPLDERQYSKVHTNVRNGETVKIQPQKQLLKQLKVSGKVKQAILTQIKHDRFNYWMFTSKSDSITQQLASLFMPETTLFQSVVVIIKPGYTHLADKIKTALHQHRYHLVMDKTVILSKNLATELILNLQKIKIDRKDLKQTIQTYSGQKIHLLCISKICAKQQMFSMLSDFNFLPKKNIIIQDYIDDNNLKEILIPVWNNPQFCLKILSQPLYNVQQSILSLDTPNLSQKHKFQILSYLIGSYYGVSINDLSLMSCIGKFSYYTTSLISANLQSWYYSQLSISVSKYVPLLFQYRPIGQSQNCLVIQSECGLPFLTLIFNQYNEQLQKLKDASNKQDRKSLVLFLWGKKLAEFTKQVSSKQITMQGWGRLQKVNQQWRGHYGLKKKKQEERQFLKYCHQKFQENMPQVASNIQKMLGSRVPQQKYKNQSKRLIPYFAGSHLDECIRIVQTDLVYKLSLVDKYKMIDPSNEKSQQKNLYAFNLYNIQPSLGSRQELIVQIMYFLMKWSQQSLEHGTIFQKILEYFSQYIVDPNFNQDSVQIDSLQYELYLKLLKQFMSGDQAWIKNIINSYPNLKKGIQSGTTSNSLGKNRKFLQKKQYYIDKHTNANAEQLNLKTKQYTKFNVNYQILQNQVKQNPLLNMDDPLHKRLAMQPHYVNLLREQGSSHKKKGIYVEYQKKLTQNEEQLLNKINNQVERYNVSKQSSILHQTALEKQLWYRKTKGEAVQTRKSKVSDAISKEIQKFISFKRQEKKDQDKKYNQQN